MNITRRSFISFMICTILDNNNKLSNEEIGNLENGNGEIGGTAFNQTFDAIWDAHVQQLVPCKICGRTFFPDRILIHEKTCKASIGSTILNRKVLQPKNSGQDTIKNNKNKNVVNISKLKSTDNLPDDHKMLLVSPQPLRRQLHQQQDAVVVVTTQDKMARIKSLGNSLETE